MARCHARMFGSVKLLCQNKIVKQMSLLYFITFFIILPILCSNLQFSIYNFKNMDTKAGREQLISENSVRVMTTKQYEKVLKQVYKIQNTRTVNRQVDLAITIITTVRNQHNLDNYQPFYLTQVVWKFLWLLNEAELSGIKHNVLLSVCNVDVRPETHQEATDLVSIIPVINRYTNDFSEHWRWNIFEKEKQDYIFCLNSSLARDPKFVLLVEDDAYPNEDLFLVLDRVFRERFDLKMDNLSSTPNSKRKSSKKITYIKLYHPERLLSYLSFEPDRLTELFGLSALFGTVLAKLCSHIFKRLTNSQINVIWFFLTVYVALVVIVIGRQHLVGLRRLFPPYLYSYMTAPECCTPAMLFPREGALDVIDHLNAHPCYASNAKDTVLDRFIQNQHRHAYIVQPNLFKHIGLFSSLREKFLNPYVVK